jgi:hypothetical protein
VGEVHGGKTKLEETVLPCGVAAGLDPVLVLINDQKFTKTANVGRANNAGARTPIALCCCGSLDPNPVVVSA